MCSVDGEDAQVEEEDAGLVTPNGEWSQDLVGKVRLFARGEVVSTLILEYVP